MGVGAWVGLVVVGALAAAAGGFASPSAKSLILYQTVAPVGQVAPVELWTTDGDGRQASELATLQPTHGGDFFRGAHLTRNGVVYAIGKRTDPNVANIFLLRRGAARARLLFAVRGLLQFAPSPDGRSIAYARDLPVAGKPLLVVALLDGSRPRTLAHAVGHTLSWSVDGKTLFAYGLSPRCWMCAITVASGATRSIDFDYRNLEAWPAVSPSGRRFAFYDAQGPAGERIYSTTGTFLRNIIGVSGGSAFWSPDEARLLLQGPGLRVFDFTTKTVRAFHHAGPSDLRVLDWAARS